MHECKMCRSRAGKGESQGHVLEGDTCKRRHRACVKREAGKLPFLFLSCSP